MSNCIRTNLFSAFDCIWLLERLPQVSAQRKHTIASASFSTLPVTVLLRDMLPLSLSPSQGSYTESDNVPVRKVCGHARIVLV